MDVSSLLLSSFVVTSCLSLDSVSVMSKGSGCFFLTACFYNCFDYNYNMKSVWVWRIALLVLILDCLTIQQLFLAYIPFYRVVKEYSNREAGLKSWKTISPDLESDTVFLIS